MVNECCVLGCKNTRKNSNFRFYSFPTRPWMRAQRDKWIEAIRKRNRNGIDWSPKPWSAICSAHFVGGKKTLEVGSPGFVPSIFPSVKNHYKLRYPDHEIYSAGREKRVSLVTNRKKSHKPNDPLITDPLSVEDIRSVNKNDHDYGRLHPVKRSSPRNAEENKEGEDEGIEYVPEEGEDEESEYTSEESEYAPEGCEYVENEYGTEECQVMESEYFTEQSPAPNVYLSSKYNQETKDKLPKFLVMKKIVFCPKESQAKVIKSQINTTLSTPQVPCVQTLTVDSLQTPLFNDDYGKSCRRASNSQAKNNISKIKKIVCFPTEHKYSQVYIFSEGSQPFGCTFTCNRYIENNVCHAEIQTDFSAPKHANVSTLTEHRVDKFFSGFSSITNEAQLRDLAGVTFSEFKLLRDTLPTDTSHRLSKEDRLLLVLIRAKTSLTFSALSVLFGTHKSTISRIYASTMKSLQSEGSSTVQKLLSKKVKLNTPKISSSPSEDDVINMDIFMA